MQRLPLDQRQVVLLAGLEKLSYAEVALALEIPIGTVMSRLSRGRVARTFARRLWVTDGEQRRAAGRLTVCQLESAQAASLAASSSS